ncbi:MAG: APC family permease [Anaerolineales bacterium]|nr:APC family permease [Anaerolineales bacterium]
MINNDETGGNIMHRVNDGPPPRNLLNWLIGRPLPTADAPNQTIGKAIGMAVFASDALSSTAYATQEMMVILVIGTSIAYSYVIPLSIAIIILLAVVILSYEQIVHAYPEGGGAYIVARDNLGDIPSQIAGAALLTDYILTAAVSISAGVAQIVSAFPALFPYRVWLSILLLFIILLINLRGVRESGRAVAFPSYFFVGVMGLTVIGGIYQYLGGSLGVVVNPPPLETIHASQAITMLVVLRAFSSGTAALTGIEAISNGVTAFKEPRGRNAGITLIWMGFILASLFLGISFIGVQVGAVPSAHETVISQIARTVYHEQNFLYLATIAGTTIILILATNTSFADFPRVSAILAQDGFLPRQMAFRGSRLVYSRGIVALAVIASLLIILLQASVTLLIPLYAIGVFLSFTLSQSGMAHRWYKAGKLSPGQEVQEPGSILRYDSHWRSKLIINSIGAVATFCVMMVFAITKFIHGAYIVLILIPLLVVFFSLIHRHYKQLASNLSLEHYGEPLRIARHRVILPISGVHRGSLAALYYAHSLSNDITAVHVSIDPEETRKIQSKWEMWGDGVRLIVLESPYRLLLEPLLKYIVNIAEKRQPDEIITVIVPQFVPHRWYHNILHTQTAFWLRLALLLKRGIVITDVPYQVD